MVYIGDLLNKLRFDKQFNPEEYTLVYFDRLEEKTFEVKFTHISRKGNFITVLKNGKEYSIPLHRVRQVKKLGKIVWEQ